MMTSQQSLHHYLSAYHSYNRCIQELMYSAPETEDELKAHFDKVHAKWLELKALEAEHYAKESEEITII